MKIDLKSDLAFKLVFEPIRGSDTIIDLIILELVYRLDKQDLSEE